MKKSHVLDVIAAGLLMMLVMVLSGCSADDAGRCETASVGKLRIKVAESGGTRAAMTLARGVTFERGDAIGVYVMDAEGHLVQSNIEVTYDGIKEWYVQGALLMDEGFSYYAYYPFTGTSGIDSHSVTPAVGTVAIDFFDSLIGGWTPANDQSTQAKLMAQDLMVAIGELTPASGTKDAELNFYMHHQMSLVQLVLDANASTTFVTNIPCLISERTYDFICKPSTSYTFTAGTIGNNGYWTTGEITSPAGNKYKSYACAGLVN